MAGIAPQSVSLIEAHGTGTVAGDQAEVEALTQVMEEAGASRASCAIGSVKSMIGHTKSAAGLAGLIKAAMALHHRVLPPTASVDTPNRKARFEESPLYINTELRPWLRRTDGAPRRAGVSSFGFGGTNFHVALEEYARNFLPIDNAAPLEKWPAELFLFGANSQEQLVSKVREVCDALENGARPACRDLAYTLAESHRIGNRETTADPYLTLAIVASSLDSLREMLAQALKDLATPDLSRIENPRGIYFSRQPLVREGKVAFLFPGQGSQYPDMLRDLTVQFPQVRARFEFADQVLKSRIAAGLSSFVFPPPRFGDAEEEAARKRLTQTELAQPALGAASMAIVDLLQSIDLQPEMTAGHSYGEYAALWAGGAFGDSTLLRLSECRGRFIQEEAGASPGTMAAVDAGQREVEECIDGLDRVWIANLNSPMQTVISGTTEGIDKAADLLSARGLRVHRMRVACAFHSPIVGAARDRLADELQSAEFNVPRLEVFSNTSGAPYPKHPAAVAEILANHLTQPVHFADEVEAMYKAGARVFVEAGPGSVLTGLVDQILEGKSHRAVPVDVPGRPGLVQLQHALGRLAVEGVALNLAPLFSGRKARRLRLESLVAETKQQARPETTWLVNGGRARPAHEPEKPGPLFNPTVAKEQPRTTAKPDAPRNQAAAETAQHPETPAAINGSGNQQNRADVMLQYQRLMNRFLETQQSVMMAYLKGKAAETVAPTASVVPVTAESAVSPREVSLQAAAPTAASSGASKNEPVGSNESPRDEEEVTRTLVGIVSDRTGYPSEMLDLDLNLEADLGINSIKKVEILGAFQRQCSESEAVLLKGAMDRLTSLKTLRAVIRGLFDALETKPEPLQAPEQKVPRYRRTLVETPAAGGSLKNPPGGVVLITDDGFEVADLLALSLRQAGVRAILLSPKATSYRSVESFAVDFTSPESIAAVIGKVRMEAGPIAGLLHLLPLRVASESSSMNSEVWRERVNIELRSLFLLARELASDLMPAPVSWFMSASAMGGDFGAGASSGSAFPGQGAIAGFTKSLAREWPNVRCRVIDCDNSAARDDLAAWLFEELVDQSPEVEVGRSHGKRWCFRTEAAPLREDQLPQIELTPDSVVLVTGGARGITSAAATELARRFRPTLYLAGRSAFPAATERDGIAGISAPHELRKALIDECNARGETPSAVSIEQTCRRILAEREIRASVRAMEETGARVHYECMDVCDALSVASLVNRIYEKHGRLDGVIHGAGVIEDGLVAEKDVKSFDRVFDTKVFGALELVRNLRPASLRFLAFFSSVAGMFGNRGQADYGAANEVLNKLALALDREWKARVFSINWGPWSGIGMVSIEVGRRFAERSISLIAPEAGQVMFASELTCGLKGEAEVILGDGPWAGDTKLADDTKPADDTKLVESRNGHHRRPDLQLPLLDSVVLPRNGSRGVDFTYILNSDAHTYLSDHQLDSCAVMPAAVGLELMAEVVQLTWPDLQVTGASDFAVTNGVVMQNGSMPLRISAREENNSNGARHVSVRIQESPAERRLYEATLILANRFEPCREAALPIQDLSVYPLTVSESYDRLLFHGPALRAIEEVHGFGRNGISATLTASAPRRLMKGATAEQWLIDPLVLDGAFQLGVIWARLNFDVTVLPVRFRTFRRFCPLVGSHVRCTLQAQPANGHYSFHATITFVDEAENLLWQIEDMEFCGSNSLNRLTGYAMRGDAA
jgi:acyl transferase domain-containing protein/NAD(P)-dependent dehydrogenase (short-subunit alcohol dehydrogenase family)